MTARLLVRPSGVKIFYRKESAGTMSIEIYGKPDCPYCAQARAYYNSKNIEFVEYDAQNDKRRQREMLEFSDGDVVVPCIVENGVYIGSGWGNPPRG